MKYLIPPEAPVTMRFTGPPDFAEEWTVSPPGQEPHKFRSHEAARLFLNTLSPRQNLKLKILIKSGETKCGSPKAES
jgi:hypothetical protein